MQKIWAKLSPAYRNYYFIFSFLILCGGLAASLWLVWTQNITFLGELHPPHDDPRTLHVKNGRQFIQTFISEGRTINGVVLFAQPLATNASGHLIVIAKAGSQVASGEIATADIPAAGQLYIPFSPPLPAKVGSQVSLRITSTTDINLRYQIDGSKYNAGTLALSTDSANPAKPIAGDVAFQIQYRGLAADSVGLTAQRTIFFTLAVAISWLVLAWLMAQSQPPATRFAIQLQRTDLIMIAMCLVVVGGVYGAASFPHITWWSTNRDYVKDVIYLSSSSQALRAGTMPAWEMNMCGGQPLLGNPEANTLSVGTLLASLVGAVAGMKIMLWLEVLIATAGAYMLGRIFGLPPLASVMPALIFGLSAFMAYRAPSATMFIAGAAALPWMLFTYVKSLERPRWLFATALITVLAFFAGDTHVIAYAVVAIVLISVYYTFRNRQLRPLLQNALLILLICLYATFKLLPVLEGQIHYHGKNLPPLVAILSANNQLADVFLDRSINHAPAPIQHGKPEGWENISSYVGILPLLAALLGLLVAPRNVRGLYLLVLGTFFVLGEGLLYDVVLRASGELRSLFRLPSRSLVVFVLILGVVAGYSIDWLKQHRQIGTIIACIILLAVTIDLGSFSYMALHRIEEIPPNNSSQPTQPPAPIVMSMSMTNPAQHPLGLLDQVASISGTCPDFNNTPLFSRRDYTGPIVTDASGNAPPQTIVNNDLLVNPSQPSSLLLVHLAYSPLLHVSGGFAYPQTDGSFQVFVPKNSSQISIKYTSSVAFAGLLLSVSSLCACLVLALRQPETQAKQNNAPQSE